MRLTRSSEGSLDGQARSEILLKQTPRGMTDRVEGDQIGRLAVGVYFGNWTVAVPMTRRSPSSFSSQTSISAV